MVRQEGKNGIRGYLEEDIKYLNDEMTITFAQDTFVSYFQKEKYFTGNKVKVLKFKGKELDEAQLKFIASCIQKAIDEFSWGIGSTVETINKTKIKLPQKNGKIDFEFMENFIAELEAQRIAELEAQRIAELEAYLKVTGLDNYVLTKKEERTLEALENKGG